MKSVALFSGLDPQTLDHVVSAARWERRGGGEALIRQGQAADSVYVMVNGAATVAIDGMAIEPGIVPGDCVGELAVLDDEPRAATVTTSEPTVLLAFDADDFHAIVEQCPTLRERLTRALTDRLRQVSNGWIRLAADTDLLLDACLTIQDEIRRPTERAEAVARAAALLQRAASLEPVDPEPSVDALDNLTPAERRVASLVADGLSNSAVADQLFVSRHTVESHLKHIYVKLAISSRVHLATMVLRSA